MAIAPRQPTPLRTTTVLRHTLPFAARVAATVLWAYDADELAEVRLGKRAPWGALPYAYWQLSLPFGDRTGDINGAAYDTQTRRIYLTGALADEQRPLVHVYSVGRGAAEGKPRTAPKTLR